MVFPSITHHGATRGVTGSCHQLHLDAQRSVLIDCGLFQGADDAGSPGKAIDFSIETLQALVVSHVHLDHVGRIPWLLAKGFRGPIICSEPSAELLPVVLEDAMKVDGAWHSSAIERCLRLLQRLIVPLRFGDWFDVVTEPLPGCRIRLQCAGHLLGSAFIEVEVYHPQLRVDRRIVFSGDLGSGSNSLLYPPRGPERADVLVLESTYGDRLHEDAAGRRRRLEQVVERALADCGTVLIPAFSIGRTQDLLFELEEIFHEKSLLSSEGGISSPVGASCPADWPQLPVILDSPLASRLTRLYRGLSHYWRSSARQRLREGRCPFSFGQLISIDSHRQHLQVVNYLKSTGRPAIVIAGNGMCSGGRIVNYLKAMLGDYRHEVVFTGYQVRGTPGAIIQASEGSERGGQVDLDGGTYTIRAKVASVSGYSAHADQTGLLAFVADIPVSPERIVLVHGGREAKAALASRLEAWVEERGVATLIEIPDGTVKDDLLKELKSDLLF